VLVLFLSILAGGVRLLTRRFGIRNG